MEKFNVYYLHINFNEDINNYIPKSDDTSEY